MSTIAIHQPNYLPWLGFFYKIYACDHFIFLDDVAYSKGSFTARTLYRKQHGEIEKTYLSVPLRKRPLGTTIDQLEIDHSKNWRVQHLNRLKQTYQGAPYFSDTFLLLETWLQTTFAHEFLASWNIYLIQQICQLLELKIAFYSSSQLPVSGKSTTYLTALIRYLDGDRYLSGHGARKYQAINEFESAGIELQYVDYHAHLEQYPYPQHQGTWVNGLSIIDALMNIGPSQIRRHFEDHPPSSAHF